MEAWPGKRLRQRQSLAPASPKIKREAASVPKAVLAEAVAPLPLQLVKGEEVRETAAYRAEPAFPPLGVAGKVLEEGPRW